MKIKVLLFALLFVASAHAQTLIGDGATDNTPIWNLMVANVCASQDREVHIPMGRFRFASAMAPIPCSLHVQGEGQGVSVFVLDYSDLNGYYVTGGIDPYGGGTLRDLDFVVSAGRTIGFCIHIQAHLETNPNIASHNPHGWLADNVSCGRDGLAPPFTGSFNYGFYIDGVANANPPAGVAPDLRYVRILHSSVAAFNILPALLYYATGSRVIDFDCPIALGAASPNVEVEFDGGNTLVYSFNCPILRP